MALPKALLVDIYCTICRHTATKNLTTLCRVSKMFQDKAEHILYYSVDITNMTDGEHLMSWCNNTAKSQRRSIHVHTLRFPAQFNSPPQDAAPTSSLHVQKSIAQALRAFINLSDLSPCIGLPEGEGTPSLLWWTFEGCRFLLTAFSGNFPGLTLDDIWNVISEHLNIHYWVPSDPFLKSLSFIPSNVLPRVVDVVFVRPDAIKYLVGRPIKHLAWFFQLFHHTRSEGTAAMIHLQLFRRSLTHLYYTYYGQQDHNWTSADIVSCLATHAPNLTSLSICCFEHVKLTVSSASLRISWIHTYYVILGWCYHCETAYQSYFLWRYLSLKIRSSVQKFKVWSPWAHKSKVELVRRKLFLVLV